MKKASTFRLDPNLQTALEEMSTHLGTTKNKIVNEALARFLEQRGQALRHNLDSTLEKLHDYRSRDPQFEDAIEQFAAAESAEGMADPYEGTSEDLKAGSLTAEIHSLLDA